MTGHLTNTKNKQTNKQTNIDKVLVEDAVTALKKINIAEL